MGEGAFGSVFEVEDKEDKKTYALKQMKMKKFHETSKIYAEI